MIVSTRIGASWHRFVSTAAMVAISVTMPVPHARNSNEVIHTTSKLVRAVRFSFVSSLRPPIVSEEAPDDINERSFKQNKTFLEK